MKLTQIGAKKWISKHKIKNLLYLQLLNHLKKERTKIKGNLLYGTNIITIIIMLLCRCSASTSTTGIRVC